ncbi:MULTISPECIES: DUF7144 family membrane protein [Gordonia]|uniref:DUF7144 domain-containing protein n=1 Tax=Gordonia sputi NBRC 100414 TaxID=1089453 RepID=H5U7J9_9ACTN|nr:MULTISPECIES: hypothetical protein [Gordonia]NKY94135.1 hypothetical protein [Gordonia sputi]GAB41707.1 hypothetical protein GOSPT_152_00060 [Gordonia sputi NBRC 100414]
MTTSQPSTKQRWAGGLSIVSGCVLLVVGILEFLQGVSAVAADNVFVVGTNYVYKFNLTTWGWIHLIIGLVVAATGIAVFYGKTFARVLAIVVLSLSVIANFLWIPYYPWWSITLIALAIVGIWALAAWSPETDEI